MSKIYLSSGISENYVARATPFLNSIKKHLNVPCLIFAVDFCGHPSEILGVQCVNVDYTKCTFQYPKKMLQSAAFTLFMPSNWQDDDVIIFCDADAYFQRPFTDSELAAFAAVKPGQFLGDYNCPNHWQSLLSEARDLFPKMPMEKIETMFPGMHTTETVNWGFIVARLGTWKELHSRTVEIWPQVDAAFGNPARVQLACIYAASQPGMEISKLPLGCHAHGHHGVQTGLTKDNDVWRLNGEVVAFAHAL